MQSNSNAMMGKRLYEERQPDIGSKTMKTLRMISLFALLMMVGFVSMGGGQPALAQTSIRR